MTKSGVSLKEEFQCKSFGFGYDKPYRFSLSEWRCSNGAFVAWRVFWALWHVGWLIRSVQDEVSDGDGDKWFIFLTNWSFLVLTIQSLLHMIIVIKNTCKGRSSVDQVEEGSPLLRGGTTTWLEKTMWFFTVVSFDAAIAVTIIYWAFVFKELTKALNIVTHAVTTFYVITDLFISATPTRMLHVIYGMSYGLAYGLFTLFYYLGDGTHTNGKPYIYEIMDWSKTGSTVGVLVGLVLVVSPIIHLFVFGLYTLRRFLSERCGCGNEAGKDKQIA